jgi:ribonuclease M5
MERVKEVIVVEGRYDKNALSQVVDAVILETSGFGIFKDSQKQKLFRTLAETKGLIVLTDSDGAGFVIRNFIKGCTDPRTVKHAYIPDIYGKERRKSTPSKEGKLGVEGMRPAVLLEALRRAGASFEGEAPAEAVAPITKADLYARGLSGGAGSAEKRQALLRQLDLPERLTADGLLDVLNALMSREEFSNLQL